MALPVGRNLSIYKGDSFELTFRLRGRDSNGDPAAYINLTGVTPKAQIRATEDSATVIAEFDCEVPTQTGADLGRLNLALTDTQTSSMVGTAKWDVQIEWPDGKVKTYLKGDVTVSKEVTRV